MSIGWEGESGMRCNFNSYLGIVCKTVNCEVLIKRHIFILFQEHHLQRAICTGLIIPTPEVLETDRIFYEKCYPADVKPTRQMIHMQRK